jgi:hypothetical protein
VFIPLEFEFFQLIMSFDYSIINIKFLIDEYHGNKRLLPDWGVGNRQSDHESLVQKKFCAKAFQTSSFDFSHKNSRFNDLNGSVGGNSDLKPKTKV